MTVASAVPSPRYAAPTTPRVRRFSVEEYHRLIEDGYFAHDERFELLDGLITQKTSRNPPHDSAVNRTRRSLERRLPAGWIVRVQSAITTSESEPEPDVAVVRGDDADYDRRHPGPADIGLLVEVASSSVDDDRLLKLGIYARAGVQVYWIVNVQDSKVEVYSQPTGNVAVPRYADRREFGRSDSVVFSLPGVAPQPIPVSEMLPAAQQ